MKVWLMMNKYPQFTYIYNKKWQTSGSSFSLSLALNEEPCYVVSSDILLDKNTIDSNTFCSGLVRQK